MILFAHVRHTPAHCLVVIAGLSVRQFLIDSQLNVLLLQNPWRHQQADPATGKYRLAIAVSKRLQSAQTIEQLWRYGTERNFSIDT